MRRYVLTLMPMLILLSACSTNRTDTRLTPDRQDTGKSPVLPKGPFVTGGAEWGDDNSTNPSAVEFSVSVPFRIDRVTVSFYLPEDCRKEEAAQKMATAWNKKTGHYCAAKAFGTMVYFIGECELDEIKKAIFYENGNRRGPLPTRPQFMTLGPLTLRWNPTPHH